MSSCAVVKSVELGGERRYDDDPESLKDPLSEEEDDILAVKAVKEDGILAKKGGSEQAKDKAKRRKVLACLNCYASRVKCVYSEDGENGARCQRCVAQRRQCQPRSRLAGGSDGLSSSELDTIAYHALPLFLDSPHLTLHYNAASALVKVIKALGVPTPNLAATNLVNSICLVASASHSTARLHAAASFAVLVGVKMEFALFSSPSKLGASASEMKTLKGIVRQRFSEEREAGCYFAVFHDAGEREVTASPDFEKLFVSSEEIQGRFAKSSEPHFKCWESFLCDQNEAQAFAAKIVVAMIRAEPFSEIPDSVMWTVVHPKPVRVQDNAGNVYTATLVESGYLTKRGFLNCMVFGFRDLTPLSDAASKRLEWALGDLCEHEVARDLLGLGTSAPTGAVVTPAEGPCTVAPSVNGSSPVAPSAGPDDASLPALGKSDSESSSATESCGHSSRRTSASLSSLGIERFSKRRQQTVDEGLSSSSLSLDDDSGVRSTQMRETSKWKLEHARKDKVRNDKKALKRSRRTDASSSDSDVRSPTSSRALHAGQSSIPWAAGPAGFAGFSLAGVDANPAQGAALSQHQAQQQLRIQELVAQYTTPGGVPLLFQQQSQQHQLQQLQQQQQQQLQQQQQQQQQLQQQHHNLNLLLMANAAQQQRTQQSLWNPFIQVPSGYPLQSPLQDQSFPQHFLMQQAKVPDSSGSLPQLLSSAGGLDRMDRMVGANQFIPSSGFRAPFDQIRSSQDRRPIL